MQARSQGGFTLIELMIVVAIIGILAAIAIPQYQTYTTRAKVSEVASVASADTTRLTEHYATQGTFPADGDTALARLITQTDGDNAADLNNIATITYNRTSAGTVDDPAVAELTYTLNGNVGDGVNNQELVYTSNVSSTSVRWDCTSDISQDYLPSGCTTNSQDTGTGG